MKMKLFSNESVKLVNNERGIALATALLLTLVALAIILAVLYYVTVATKHSAASRRYRNVQEATNGGAELFTKELLPMVFTGSSSTDLLKAYPGIGLSFGTYTSSIKHKISTATAMWDPAMVGPNATVKDPKVAPDVTFKLNGLPYQPKFNVFAKIVDTVPGNSDTSGYSNGSLDNGSGVAYAGSSNISPVHQPALLTIEVEGERETNAKEKARLSVVYSY